MPAEDHLGPQFFHGTNAELQPGDVVRPSAEVGVRHHEQLPNWRAKHVWMTDNETGAWRYADLVKGGRKSVYEVEPLSAPQKRRRLGEYPPISEGREYTASTARVKRRIDIPPPNFKTVYGDRSVGPNEESIAGNTVQGTLGMDWKAMTKEHQATRLTNMTERKNYGTDRGFQEASFK